MRRGGHEVGERSVAPGLEPLSDLQTSLDTGLKVTAAQRIADTIDYAVLGEQLGLDDRPGRAARRPMGERMPIFAVVGAGPERKGAEHPYVAMP